MIFISNCLCEYTSSNEIMGVAATKKKVAAWFRCCRHLLPRCRCGAPQSVAFFSADKPLMRKRLEILWQPEFNRVFGSSHKEKGCCLVQT
jgi:hypothetical protein